MQAHNGWHFNSGKRYPSAGITGILNNAMNVTDEQTEYSSCIWMF